MDMVSLKEAERRYVQGVGFLTGLCVAFYAYRSLLSETFRYSFVFENLALAWLGLFFGWLLARWLKSHSWLEGKSVGLTFLWLAFLPNTWYVLTDFLHVGPTGEISELYDIVLVGMLSLVGFILGFTSLFLVHQQMRRRFSEQKSVLLVVAVIFLASFAIYLGRDLRWNSWDVIADPSGLILDVSDRVIDPLGHLRAINITGLFFVLLNSIYFSFWAFVKPFVPVHKR